jgi:hypothetical protein
MQWFEDIQFAYHEIGVWTVPQAGTDDATNPDLRTFVLAKQLVRSVWPKPVLYESDSAPEGSDLQTGYIEQTIQTAWISPFGLAGWGKLHKVVVYFERYPGQGTDSTPLTMSVTTQGPDGERTQSGLWQIDQGSTAGNGVSYRELQMTDTSITALKVQLGDQVSVADTRGRGFRFMALAIEVGAPQGIRPLLDAEKQ